MELTRASDIVMVVGFLSLILTALGRRVHAATTTTGTTREDRTSTTSTTCQVASEEASSGRFISFPSIQSLVVGEEPFRSTILVWDNFLDPVFLESLYETYLGNRTTQWKTVIPHHQNAYQAVSSFLTDANPLFRAPSQAPGNGGFPGLRANLTSAYREALHQKILEDLPTEMIQSVTGTSIVNEELRWSSTDSFFGNLCYHQNSLSLDQRLPHIDQGHVERRPVQMALVHYLSPGFSGHGGTAFYAETVSGGNRFRYRDCRTLKEKAIRNGFKSGTTAFVKASSCHCKPHNLACAQYQWYVDQVVNETTTKTPPSYASTTTEWYQLLHHVEYKYNRAVLYDARQLHSAFVDKDTLTNLTCDPTRGRLTANIFLG